MLRSLVEELGLSPLRAADSAASSSGSRSAAASSGAAAVELSRDVMLKRRRRELGGVLGSLRVREEVPLSVLQASRVDALLGSLGVVSGPGRGRGTLQARDVGGGGWCFFLAFADQLGDGVVPDVSFLAVLALAELARRRATFEVAVPGASFDGSEDLDVLQARCALQRFRPYRGRVDAFGPFAVTVLDKFEGVLAGDLLEPRRYADHMEMHCLLESCALRALVVDGSGATVEACERLSRVQPRGDTWAEAVPELRVGSLDMVFARYDTPGWQHFRSVRFLDGSAWRVSDEARGRVAARLAACDVCQALLVGDVDLARGLLLSLLGSVSGGVASARVVGLE